MRIIGASSLLAIIALAQPVFGGPGEPTTEIARLYKAAKTGSERRDICIRAIDEGLIRPGTPIRTIDTIFGSTYARLRLHKGTSERGIIYFTELPAPPPGVQAAHVGWYFAFDFDSDGSLENYRLSNIHK